MQDQLSTYNDCLASDFHIENELKRLQLAFPEMKREFMLLLSQRIVANKMTVTQLTDSVNNLLDNYKYKTFSIADVVGFDKKIKLYTHKEVVKMLQDGFSFNDFNIIDLNGQKRWYLNNR